KLLICLLIARCVVPRPLLNATGSELRCLKVNNQRRDGRIRASNAPAETHEQLHGLGYACDQLRAGRDPAYYRYRVHCRGRIEDCQSKRILKTVRAGRKLILKSLIPVPPKTETRVVSWTKFVVRTSWIIEGHSRQP